MNATKKKTGKDPLRSFRVPDSHWKRWKREAKKLGISVSELIRSSVDERVRQPS